MCPATLPMMLRLIALMTLLSIAPPTTTSIVPPRITDPMRRLIRDRNRLRPAMRSRMPIRASTSVSSGDRRRPAGKLPSDDLPVSESNDRVRVGHHLRVMRREDEGGSVPLIHLPHQVDDPLASDRVEVRGGLVREDDLRAADKRPGDRHPLTLSTGKLIGSVTGVVGETDLLEESHHPSPALVAPELPLEEQRELHVLEHAEDANQVEALENEADGVEAEPRQLPLAEGRGVPADDAHRAPG